MTNLYDLLNSEYSAVTITNETFYRKFPQRDNFNFDELKKELLVTEDEICCIEESYINGLAAHTSILVVNKKGEVVRGKLLIIS